MHWHTPPIFTAGDLPMVECLCDRKADVNIVYTGQSSPADRGWTALLHGMKLCSTSSPPSLLLPPFSLPPFPSLPPYFSPAALCKAVCLQSTYVCMYVCMYVYMYVWTYVCMYMYACMDVWYVCICMHVWTYDMYVCMYVCTYVCMYARMLYTHCMYEKFSIIQNSPFWWQISLYPKESILVTHPCVFCCCKFHRCSLS